MDRFLLSTHDTSPLTVNVDSAFGSRLTFTHGIDIDILTAAGRHDLCDLLAVMPAVHAFCAVMDPLDIMLMPPVPCKREGPRSHVSRRIE